MKKKVEFEKYGFVRREELNFVRYIEEVKVYEYKGIIFNYLKDRKNHYFYSDFKSRDYPREMLDIELTKLGNKINSILRKFSCVETLTNNQIEGYTKKLDKAVNYLKRYEDLKNKIKEVVVYKFKECYLVEQVYEGCIETRIDTKVVDENYLNIFRNSNIEVVVKELVIR